MKKPKTIQFNIEIKNGRPHLVIPYDVLSATFLSKGEKLPDIQEGKSIRVEVDHDLVLIRARGIWVTGG